MPAERYYLPQTFTSGSIIQLVDTEFHHLVHVMRGRIDERIELVNGMGSLAVAKITALEKKKALIEVLETHYTPPPAGSTILAQAIPRPNRLDTIVEKGTELGMTSLWLFPAQQGERASLTDHQLDRYKAMSIAAMKQSGRLYLPQIFLKQSLATWVKPEGFLLFGDFSTDAKPLASISKPADIEEIVFFVGPESGFSVEEIDLLRNWHACGVTLHKNILRTDTAALTALALLSQFCLSTNH